ncbi:DUF4296 domain-containing protein [Bacteroidetes bacterium endosymbiont of Geopemphigus sp.]|uniref:DUF4296 domain-containing protein n=1 Tax=Bacteroidetes bacterium endosymbiont of Geopemphigus sp. TaxID=2047937 RepID=UPI000CD198B2|nr:DUF4296 domain-containing protein [Bacteroidetes bacterium endosymbiont of Geopemphigus sp.]
MKKIFLTGFILVLFSCKKETPSKILARDQMKEVLVDLFICKEVALLSKAENSSREDQLIEEEVFKKHHTNKEQFEKSHKYYLKNNESYLDILIKAQNRVKELQSQHKN